MPNRILKESLCTSETIAQLSDFEYRVWTGLILIADDLGRGDARAAVIKGRVFPLRERVTAKDIDAAVHGLAGKGCISLYEVDGKSYFYFPTWSEHQRVRDSKPKYPAPPDAEYRGQDGFAASCGELRRVAASCGELRPESNPNPNPYPNLPSPDGEGSGDFPGKPPAAAKSDLQTVVDAWNTLNLNAITKLTPETERYIMLKKRIADYGLDKVLQAIENVRASPFLNGHNRKGFTCTFDWFVKPNNFPKVLDGNYNDGEKPKLDQRAYDGAKWLAEQIAERVSGFQTPKPQELDRWAADLDALHRQGYTWKQISDTAVWALGDDFWCPVIVSGAALRKNFVTLLSKREIEHD